MTAPDLPPTSADIVINAPALDFYDSSEALYEHGFAPHEKTEQYEEIPEARIVADSLAKILALKQHRESDTSALDIKAPDAVEALRQDRASAVRLMNRLAADIATTAPNTDVMFYGFADIAELGAHPPEHIYHARLEGHPLVVRAEETLAPRANKLIDEVQHALRTGTHPGARLSDDGDSVIRETQQGGTSTTPLRGYTFNRSGQTEEERQTFTRFPSCETFMGAGILEQLEYGERVVRIIPASMKNREHATKHLLGLAGYTDLNVLTAVVSETGDVQSVIPWTERRDDASAEMLRPLIQQYKAHTTSGQVAERVHNQTFAGHRVLFDAFEKPGSENIAPSKLLDSPIVTDRIHEFFSRPFRAAPLYEGHRLTAATAPEALTNLKVAAELFSHIYQPADKVATNHPRLVERIRGGEGSNDVLYTQVVVAGKREPEPALMAVSDEISLVAHFVHEHADDEFEQAMCTASNNTQELFTTLQDRPPRYMLLEGVRLKQGMRPEVGENAG